MPKEKTSTHKTTGKSNHTIEPEKLEELESLFFMGGITPYSASKQVGIDPKTAKIYFEEWAEKLVDDEQ